MNFYSLVTGEPVLMTLDHIVPRSKGGKHVRKNGQAMCTTCNLAKADSMPK